MGFWSRVSGQAKSQFLEVIEWLDDSRDTIVYRYPVYDNKITDKSKLVVREGQTAVFIAEGVLSDVFGPGTYTLDTPNSPIMSFFQSIKYAMNTPYKGDIYFVSTNQFMNNGWGTANPVMMRDQDFGVVRVRAFGSYSFRVIDPAKFMREVVGTDGHFTTDEITKQLRQRVVTQFTTALGKTKMPVLDLAASYMDVGDTVKDAINPSFEDSYGIKLTDFTISNVSVPPEVEKALDTRSKMGVIGNLNAYTQMKAADAIETAAANPGMGGLGASMGVGMGVGNMVGQAMGNMAGGGGAAAPPPPPGGATYHYSGPSGQAQLSASAIAEKIKADPTGAHNVWQQGWAAWKPWKDVPEIVGQIPPSAPPPPPGQAKFHYHGPSGQSEKTAGEIAQLVAADPSGSHSVWQQGWDGWKPAADVPEIKAKMGAAPPPPPGGAGGPPPIG